MMRGLGIIVDVAICIVSFLLVRTLIKDKEGR